MTLVKFNGNKPDQALISGFNDVFDSVFNDTFFNDRLVIKVPPVNILESSDMYHIELAAPGLKKENFKINLERNMLSVGVEHPNEEGNNQKNYTKREYNYNSFVRSFSLPDAADQSKIDARYVDGILHVEIAKREEAKVVSRQIEIK